MEKNLLYLVDNYRQVKVYYIHQEKEVYSTYSFLNQLTKQYFFTMENYRRLAKKKFAFKNKIPIYFSDDLIIFYLVDKSTKARYLINYAKVLQFCFDGAEIKLIFDNALVLSLNASVSLVKNEIQKCLEVAKYFKKLA